MGSCGLQVSRGSLLQTASPSQPTPTPAKVSRPCRIWSRAVRCPPRPPGEPEPEPEPPSGLPREPAPCGTLAPKAPRAPDREARISGPPGRAHGMVCGTHARDAAEHTPTAGPQAFLAFTPPHVTAISPGSPTTHGYCDSPRHLPTHREGGTLGATVINTQGPQQDSHTLSLEGRPRPLSVPHLRWLAGPPHVPAAPLGGVRREEGAGGQLQAQAVRACMPAWVARRDTGTTGRPSGSADSF